MHCTSPYLKVNKSYENLKIKTHALIYKYILMISFRSKNEYIHVDTASP